MHVRSLLLLTSTYPSREHSGLLECLLDASQAHTLTLLLIFPPLTTGARLLAVMVVTLALGLLLHLLGDLGEKTSTRVKLNNPLYNVDLLTTPLYGWLSSPYSVRRTSLMLNTHLALCLHDGVVPQVVHVVGAALDDLTPLLVA